ncbi:MAG TPA: polysaccharide deacetylase family protein [Clostridiaceae bacterium]|nr:polysaccharide deacetylase family protein [Clostridiaceae bacterium]
MRIYVIKLKTLIKLMLLFILIVVFLAVAGNYYYNSVSVSASNRELPIYSVECENKVAAITFDCAWGSDDIPEILETLRKEDVKATFFIVGQWAEKFPDVVKMIVNDGHDIANHSYSHLRMGAIDRDRIKKEISVCGEILKKLSNQKVDLFRAPYGDYSNNVINIARSLGYFTIQWDVDSLDWKPGISQDEILNRITKRIKPGSIILFHNDTPHTSKLLPTIIKNLKNEGYSFLPVSKLILRDNYYIDFEGRQRKKG